MQKLVVKFYEMDPWIVGSESRLLGFVDEFAEILILKGC